MSKGKLGRVRVDLRPIRYGNTNPLDIVLDMLRYTGLLHCNVEGFPEFIEYDASPVTADLDISRWASFGCKAKYIPFL